MKQLFILFLAATASESNAFAQDGTKIVRETDNRKLFTTTDSFYASVPNTIFVSFYEGFNDSTFVFINDTCIYRNYLESNESIGVYIGIPFKDSSSMLNMIIRLNKTNIIINDRLNLNYKSLQVRWLYQQWHLIYTNHFPLLE